MKKILMGGMLALLPWAAAAVENLDREKLTIEREIKARLDEAISKFVDPALYILAVQVEPTERFLGMPTWYQQIQLQPILAQETEKPKPPFVLPGVPRRPESEGAVRPPAVAVVVPPKEEPADIAALQPFIRKMTVLLTLDNSVSPAAEQTVLGLIRRIAGLDEKRGDSLKVERLAFSRRPLPPPVWQKVLANPYAFWTVAVLLVASFLFGPFWRFLRQLVAALSGLARPREGGPAEPGLPAAAAGAPGAATLQMQVPEKAAGPRPFSFISRPNVPNLAYLLREESPERAAVILSYLSPEIASEVLAALDERQQAEISLELSKIRQLDPEDVEVLEAELKRKIDYLVGGYEKLLALCETAPRSVRQRILAGVAEQDPELADRVRRALLSVDDLARLDGPALRLLMREVSPAGLAAALRNATDGVREKVISLLPEGAAEMVRQELEMGAPPAPSRIDEEERRVVMVLKRFRQEGRFE